MLHATLNFQTGGEPARRTIDRYRRSLYARASEEMEDQPYLVLVTKMPVIPISILSARSSAPTAAVLTPIAWPLIFPRPTRKAIEKEFDLQPAQRHTRIQVLSPDEVRKIVPGNDRPITQSIDDITATVTKHYQFTDLPEYNAILRAYNVMAETGGPGSKTRRHNGIYYTALDDHGNKISLPVMASQLPNRPTLKRLNERFEESRQTRNENITSIRHRLDWILDQEPSTLRVLAAHLQRDGIEIVSPPSNGRNPRDHIYVDHRTRTAVAGSSLGQAYTAMALGSSFKKWSFTGINIGKSQSKKSLSTPILPQLLSART